MPSFSDSIFLFVLALLLFGPKKLPVLARELGKWIGEFRRASNEFKMQMEEELRVSEQADRQKQIAAMEAAAPVAPSLEAEPEHPHLPASTYDENSDSEPLDAALEAEAAGETPSAAIQAPLPIASSGSLNLMPPSTGLPLPRSRGEHSSGDEATARHSDPLGGLIDSIPSAPGHTALSTEPQETPANA